MFSLGLGSTAWKIWGHLAEWQEERRRDVWETPAGLKWFLVFWVASGMWGITVASGVHITLSDFILPGSNPSKKQWCVRLSPESGWRARSQSSRMQPSQAARRLINGKGGDDVWVYGCSALLSAASVFEKEREHEMTGQSVEHTYRHGLSDRLTTVLLIVVRRSLHIIEERDTSPPLTS